MYVCEKIAVQSIAFTHVFDRKWKLPIDKSMCQNEFAFAVGSNMKQNPLDGLSILIISLIWRGYISKQIHHAPTKIIPLPSYSAIYLENSLWCGFFGLSHLRSSFVLSFNQSVVKHNFYFHSFFLRFHNFHVSKKFRYSAHSIKMLTSFKWLRSFTFYLTLHELLR